MPPCSTFAGNVQSRQSTISAPLPADHELRVLIREFQINLCREVNSQTWKLQVMRTDRRCFSYQGNSRGITTFQNIHGAPGTVPGTSHELTRSSHQPMGEALFLFHFTNEETDVERLNQTFFATRMCQFSRHSYSKTPALMFHGVYCKKHMNIQDEMENSKRYYAPCSWSELSCPHPQFRKAPRRPLEQKVCWEHRSRSAPGINAPAGLPVSFSPGHS